MSGSHGMVAMYRTLQIQYQENTTAGPKYFPS
jgi:hypothetical protein